MAKRKKPSIAPEIVNQAMIKAFVLRFRGYSYEQIEQKLLENNETTNHYTARTMELYFMKGGRWHELYKNWLVVHVNDITEQVSNSFVAQALMANQMVVKIAAGHLAIEYTNKKGKVLRKNVSITGKTILAANQDILDRAGFKPVERFQSTDAEDIAERIMQRYEAKTKKKK